MEIIATSFYKYVNVKYPENFQRRHFGFCNKLGIKGKILVSKEGINGAISGTREQVEKYKREIIKNKLFKGIVFNDSYASEYPFKKTIVRVRKEIVTSGLKVNLRNKGKYISPAELNKLIESNDDFILVDARNNYESKIGKFKGAITPNIETFREFKSIINDLNKFKDKKIVTYCTGGVRCEKASAFLRENGLTNVFQLGGGIINYINQFPDEYFEGRCFVFDDRLSIQTGRNTKDITICELCHIPSGRYINCANKKCDNLFICCEECDVKLKHTCSKKCRTKVF